MSGGWWQGGDEVFSVPSAAKLKGRFQCESLFHALVLRAVLSLKRFKNSVLVSVKDNKSNGILKVGFTRERFVKFSK